MAKIWQSSVLAVIHPEPVGSRRTAYSFANCATAALEVPRGSEVLESNGNCLHGTLDVS